METFGDQLWKILRGYDVPGLDMYASDFDTFESQPRYQQKQKVTPFYWQKSCATT